MPEPILLNHNAQTGISDYFHVIEDGKEWAIESRQVLDPMLEVNQQMQHADTGRWGDGRCVASIPLVVLEQLRRDGMIDGMFNVKDNTEFTKWLNKSENKRYRWKLGRV